MSDAFLRRNAVLNDTNNDIIDTIHFELLKSLRDIGSTQQRTQLWSSSQRNLMFSHNMEVGVYRDLNFSMEIRS